jgi:soluble lytic murein transglycosylase-like protein
LRNHKHSSHRDGCGTTAQKAAPRNPSKAKPDPGAYSAIIESCATEFSLDPKLLHAMIATESGFNPEAVSQKGAQGLMQLMPATAARLGVSDPFDPKENIWGGARYMRYLLDTFAEPAEDALILSLAAYNAGENLVLDLGRVPNIRETNEYISSITQRYGKRKMDAPPPAVAVSSGPRTFQYFDEKGILILTNIPPIDRSRSASQTSGSNLINR